MERISNSLNARRGAGGQKLRAGDMELESAASDPPYWTNAYHSSGVAIKLGRGIMAVRNKTKGRRGHGTSALRSGHQADGAP